MRIVLDTNVLVSALLSPHGPPARIVSHLLSGASSLIFDERILHEYRAVLARPRFGFHADDVATLLKTLEAGGMPVVAAPLPLRLPDPDDLPFLEVAVAARADVLVTGNRRHFIPLEGQHDAVVETPADFLRRLAQAHESAGADAPS